MTDWDRIWRGSCIGAVLFLVVAGALYGTSPKVGASAEKLVSFYDGDRTRILIATVIFCIGFLNLLWFAVALSTDLRDTGKGGWGAAVTASSAALGAILFTRMTVARRSRSRSPAPAAPGPHPDSTIWHRPCR
jgi:hypothetical protein